MKFNIITLCTLFFLMVCPFIPVNAQETVSIKPGYTHQTWYSLSQGNTWQEASDDWDLAFEIEGFTAAVRVNEARGLELFQVPGLDISGWASVDTTGMGSWLQLHNSNESWGGGAFNHAPFVADEFDVGWGLYNPITHKVEGDSLYVMKLWNGNFIKIKIDELYLGTYAFTFADLDGSNEYTINLNKSDYAGKNFGYYSMEQATLRDLDPLSVNWDLYFSRYVEELSPGVFYGVTGILTNYGVEVAEFRQVDINMVTIADTAGGGMSDQINTIGHDWKSYDLSNSVWVIEDSLCYFVQDNNDNVFKLTFTGFGGGMTGDFIFDKTTVVTDIEDLQPNISKFIVYPNPSSGQFSVLVDTESPAQAQLSLIDVTGKQLMDLDLGTVSGFREFRFEQNELSPGMYWMRLSTVEGTAVRKLIVR